MPRLKLVKEFPLFHYTGNMKKDLLTLFKDDGVVYFRDDDDNDEYIREKFEKEDNDYIIAFVSSTLTLSWYMSYYGSKEWNAFKRKYNLEHMWMTYDLAGIYIDDDSDDDSDEED